MVTDNHSGGKNRQFISFFIDEYLMGIDILKVREVNLLLDITPVQHAQDYVRGLINLRGLIVTVLDLGVKLGRPPGSVTEESHNIILKSDDVGILVDRLGEVVDAREDELEPLPANLEVRNSKYFEGVIKLDTDLLMIISPEKLLEQIDRGSETMEAR